jgi:hypothetical protein
MSNPVEADVLDILLDIAENDPPLAQILALVEPTKSVYRVLGNTNTRTKQLALSLQATWASHLETVSNPMPRGLCVYSTREISGMQEQGVSHHATEPLSS